MNNKQRAKTDSYNRISDFNTKYAAQTETIVEYEPEKTAFDQAFANINNALGVQVSSSGINSQNTTELKNEMADTIIKYVLRAAVKAKQIDNISLAQAFNVAATFIKQAPKTLAIHRAQDLIDTMKNNLSTLTNLSADNIKEMNAAVALYNSSKDQPRETLQNKKAAGTDVLPAQFAAADEAIDNMYNLLRSYFETDNAALVDEFSLAMEIIDTGIRHTSIDFTIIASETDEPLAAADITDLSNEKIYTSGEDGTVHIGSHRSGHFNFTITAAGRQTVNLGTEVGRGKQNSFTVKLVLM